MQELVSLGDHPGETLSTLAPGSSFWGSRVGTVHDTHLKKGPQRPKKGEPCSLHDPGSKWQGWGRNLVLRLYPLSWTMWNVVFTAPSLLIVHPSDKDSRKTSCPLSPSPMSIGSPFPYWKSIGQSPNLSLRGRNLPSNSKAPGIPSSRKKSSSREILHWRCVWGLPE